MMTKGIEYNELSRAKVAEVRNVVISSCSKGGFTVAQQLEAKENEMTTTVFMKGAFHIDNIEGLINLRDAMNVAINKAEKLDHEDNKVRWD